MAISERGEDNIKRWESLRLKPYLCSAGVPTIGWGTTRYPDGRRVRLSDPVITRAQADAYFRHDLAGFERGVDRLAGRRLPELVRCALVSFAYNVGLGALQASTLLRKVKRGDLQGAAAEFRKWVYAGGRRLRGLVRRRQAEEAMFRDGLKAMRYARPQPAEQQDIPLPKRPAKTQPKPRGWMQALAAWLRDLAAIIKTADG